MLKLVLSSMLSMLILLPTTAFTADPSVARALFTTAIEDREPTNELTDADTSLTSLKYFTELLNFEGQTIVHLWTYNGQMMTAIPFKVKGPRWRVYSSKNLIPEWIGTWKVDVLDSNGDIVASSSIEYTIGKNNSTDKEIAPAPATVVADEVIRAQFTSSIDDREPSDSLSALAAENEEVFFFCEIEGMTDKKIVHRWIYNDMVMAEVPFNIGGPRWRVYSSKKMIPAWIGTWRVDIVDDEGTILTSKMVQKTNNISN